MISVLIPVYNFDINRFVTDIHKQLVRENIPFEIILLDDGSETIYKTKNKHLNRLSHVVYEELPANVGWSAIRNLLAEKAKYENLLFADCDSEVNDDFFIKNYLNYLNTRQVVFGGRNYHKNPPEKSRYLRWLHGTRRETIPAKIRNKSPYTTFMSNNFLIPKEVMHAVQFPENILRGYGHDDTLFAMELKKNHIPIFHIDNPLTHIGLETNEEYLHKTESALRNLFQLIRLGKLEPEFKVYKAAEKLEKLKLSKRVGKYFLKRQKKLKSKLIHDPNLLRFDMYKLGYLTAYMHGLTG